MQGKLVFLQLVISFLIRMSNECKKISMCKIISANAHKILRLCIIT